MDAAWLVIIGRCLSGEQRAISRRRLWRKETKGIVVRAAQLGALYNI
jgi:hypothetical protein